MPHFIPPPLLIQPHIPRRITTQVQMLFDTRRQEFSVLLCWEGTIGEGVDLREDCAGGGRESSVDIE